jgi:hypothetical protein
MWLARQGWAANWRISDVRISAIGLERFQTLLLVISVHVFVFLNTLIFFSHASIPNEFFSELNDNSKVKCRRTYDGFRVLLVASLISSGMVIVLLLFSFGSPPARWDHVLEFNEYLQVALFLFFTLSNLMCIEACSVMLGRSSGLSAASRPTVDLVKRRLRLYLLASDFPGLLGMLLIVGIGHGIHSQTTSLYINGFVTGATALHISFSQSTLAFIDAYERHTGAES